MSENRSCPIPDDKMMAYLYDDVDDADIFGFGDAGEESTKNNDHHSEEKLDINSLEVLNENQILKEELQKLQMQKDTLERKISEVYKTAKQEMERKDKRLRQLQEEQNNLIFRRNNRQRFGYREDHHNKDVRVEGHESLELTNKEIKQELTNNSHTSMKIKAEATKTVVEVSSKKNYNIHEVECKKEITVLKIEEKIPFANDFQHFNTDYKIPKKIADNSNESEQKWIKSNVMGNRDSLSPPRQKVKVQEHTDCQDKRGKYPTTPSRNQRYQEDTRLRGSPRRCKSKSTSDGNCLEAGDDLKTPSRRNTRRTSSNSPQRSRHYQDRSRQPKTPAGSCSKFKSRSKSCGNRVGADGKREYARKNRSSSRSPHRRENLQSKSPRASPLRHKSVENRTCLSPKHGKREKVDCNSPLREKCEVIERNRRKSSSRSPQRRKSFQDEPRQTRTPLRSPLRHKSRSTSCENRVNDRQRKYHHSPSRQHRSSSRSPHRHKMNQDRSSGYKSSSASSDNRVKAIKEKGYHSPSRDHRSSSRSPRRHTSYKNRPREPKTPSKSPLRSTPSGTNKEKRHSKSPSREHRSSSRSPQRYKNYQDGSRHQKRQPRSPLNDKLRSAGNRIEVDPRGTNRRRGCSKSPSREHRSSSRSPQRLQKVQDIPRQAKTRPRTPLGDKSRPTSAGDNRDRVYYKSPLREHRSSSRSPHRHRKYQDRGGSPMRDKSKSISAGHRIEEDPKGSNRGRGHCKSPSRQQRSSSRSPQRRKNYQDKSRQPPRSPISHKSRSASVENKDERAVRNHDRFPRKTANDECERKKQPRTPSGSPPRPRRPRTPSPRRNIDRRRRSRSGERGTRGRNIKHRLGWGGRRNNYDSVDRDRYGNIISRRQGDYRRGNDCKIRLIEQLKRTLKQRSVDRDPKAFKFGMKESEFSDPEGIGAMTDEDIMKLIREKQKELMSEDELTDIDEGHLMDEDEYYEDFKEPEKESYQALLDDAKNIRKQVQKDISGIKKPQLSPNIETKPLETVVKSPDVESLKPEKSRTRINLAVYKKRMEEDCDLAKREVKLDVDFENQKKSQKDDPKEESKDIVNEKFDKNEEEVNLIDSDYKYTPAIDEEAKLDIIEDRNSSNSFYNDFDLSEDENRFRKSEENKKEQLQDIKTAKINSNLDPKTEVSSNFETHKKNLSTAGSKPEVDITNKKSCEEDIENIKEKTNEKSDSQILPVIIEDKDTKVNSLNSFYDDFNMSDDDDRFEKNDSPGAIKADYKPSVENDVKVVESVENCAAKSPKVKILSNVVIAHGPLPTAKKLGNIENLVESMESIQEAVLRSEIEMKSFGIPKQTKCNPQLSTEELKESLEGEICSKKDVAKKTDDKIKDKIDQKTDLDRKNQITDLFGEMTPTPRKPDPEPKVKQNSRQVQQAKRQLKLQIDPVKTIKKSPRSRKKVESKQLLMQSEIVGLEKVETKTVVTKLEDLRHNNPSFIPYLHDDNKAFDTPNTYIKKKNGEKKKPAAKKSKEPEKPKVVAKKREVFRIRLQTNRKKKKIQNFENSSSEFSSDSHSDTEPPENNKKLKMEPKKTTVTKKVNSDKKNVEESKKKQTNNAKNEEIEDDIKVTEVENKSESIEHTETKTNKRNRAKPVKKCDSTKNKSKDNVESKPNKRSRTKSVKVDDKVQIEEKVSDTSKDESKNTGKRNRAKPVKIEENSGNTERETDKKIQAEPEKVTDTIEEKIPANNEEKSENGAKINTSHRNRSKPIKIEIVQLHDKTEDSAKTETKCQANPNKVEEKITDFTEISDPKTSRRRIQPTKVGEVTPSIKRKLDTQETIIPNKLPKLEKSPLPHMENMLKQLENKSTPQSQSPIKITAVNVEDGVVEINLNSKDAVFLGDMEQFMYDDLSNYLNVSSDRKIETSFSNFQLKNLNTSTPKKPLEKKEEDLVESGMKEDTVCPINVSDSSKEYLKAPLKRDRRRRVKVEMITLPS